MTPTPLPLSSTRLSGQVSAHAARSSQRFSTTTCFFVAKTGSMTFFAGFFSYGLSAGAWRSQSSTMLREWEMRVLRRRSTGTSNCSESS